MAAGGTWLKLQVLNPVTRAVDEIANRTTIFRGLVYPVPTLQNHM